MLLVDCDGCRGATFHGGTARRSPIRGSLLLDCRGPLAILAPGRGQTFRHGTSRPVTLDFVIGRINGRGSEG